MRIHLPIVIAGEEFILDCDVAVRICLPAVIAEEKLVSNSIQLGSCGGDTVHLTICLSFSIPRCTV